MNKTEYNKKMKEREKTIMEIHKKTKPTTFSIASSNHSQTL